MSIIVLLVIGGALFAIVRYKRKLKNLKELLYVEYSNYSNPEQPRHFDNPVYSSMPSNSTKLLNNNLSANTASKNTNLIKSKILNDFEHEKPELGNLYETTNSNLYVELDEDKTSKVNNFYHTIDEIDASYKADSPRPIPPNNVLSFVPQPSTSKNLPHYVNNLVNDYDVPKPPSQQSRSYINIAKKDDPDANPKK